jgi:hypothetical protein
MLNDVRYYPVRDIVITGDSRTLPHFREVKKSVFLELVGFETKSLPEYVNGVRNVARLGMYVRPDQP